MKIAVLGSPDSWYLSELRRAAGQRHGVESLGFDGLWSSFDGIAGPLAGFDGAIIRSMPPGSLEQIVFRMDMLATAEAAGVVLLNPPRAMEVAVDKFLSTGRLAGAGLLTPATHVSQTWKVAIEGFHALGGDVVLKPLFGGEGRGITRISDEELAHRAFKTLQQLGSVIYQQEFIEHEGYDLRLLVLGDQIWGMRRSNCNDWRTNVSRGALTEPLEVSDELRQLAHRAADAVGAPFAGVDVLDGRDGRRYVLEVNAVPGWKALSTTLSIDIAGEVLNYLERTVPR